jgi:hypothetical protein
MEKFSEILMGKELEEMFKKIYNKISNNAKEKFCFNKNEECNNKIIRAHSIQENRILSQLSENGDVLYIEYGDGELKFNKVGKGKATTFTGFCGYHDSKIFSPIENYDFIKENKEQEFLFAYRIIAREYYAKIHNKNICEKFVEALANPEKEIIEGYPLQFLDYYTLEECKIRQEQLLKSLNYDIRDLKEYKKILNKSLEQKKFEVIETYCLELDGQCSLAVAAWCYLTQDLNGKVINDTSDCKEKMKPLLITVFPQNNKTYILLSYFNKDKHKYKAFINQLKKLKDDMKKIVISNLIVSNCENFVYSLKYYDVLSENKKELIKYGFQYENRERNRWFFSTDLNLFEDK